MKFNFHLLYFCIHFPLTIGPPIGILFCPPSPLFQQRYASPVYQLLHTVWMWLHGCRVYSQEFILQRLLKNKVTNTGATSFIMTLMHIWHMGSRWCQLDHYVVTTDIWPILTPRFQSRHEKHHFPTSVARRWKLPAHQCLPQITWQSGPYCQTCHWLYHYC